MSDRNTRVQDYEATTHAHNTLLGKKTVFEAVVLNVDEAPGNASEDIHQVVFLEIFFSLEPLSKHHGKVAFEVIAERIDPVHCGAQLLLLNFFVVAEVKQVFAILDLPCTKLCDFLFVTRAIHAGLNLEQVFSLMLRLQRLCDCSDPWMLVGTDVLKIGYSSPLLVIVVAVAHLNFIRTIHNNEDSQFRRNWQLTPGQGSDSHLVLGFGWSRNSYTAELKTLIGRWRCRVDWEPLSSLCSLRTLVL
jgi:hypothetical protein